MKKHAYTAKHKVLAGVAAVGLATALAVPFVAYGADAPALGWGIAGSRAGGASCASAGAGNANCLGYVDEDGNGACDNAGSCDGNGQGAGQSTGYGRGHGSGNGGGHHGMCAR